MNPLAKRLLPAILVAAGAICLIPAQRAAAYVKDTWQPWCTSEIPWAADPVIYMLTSSAHFDQTYKQSAVQDIASAINEVGDQWLDWTVIPVSSTPKGFDNGISEMWIGSPAETQYLTAYTYTWVDNITDCHTNEADIVLLGTEWQVDIQADWTVGTASRPYHDPPFFGDQARGVLVHEFGHAMGLDHENATYSTMMQENAFPTYTAGTTSRQTELLPDDRRGLRDLYDTNGSETDWAITNTRRILFAGDPQNSRTCLISRGDEFVSASDWCGDIDEDPENVVAGEFMYARFTVNNYSTSSATATVQYWFSTDTEWHGNDVLSPSSLIIPLSDGRSSTQSRTIEVPDNLQSCEEYKIIARIIPLAGEEGSPYFSNNAIPLRGMLKTAGCQ